MVVDGWFEGSWRVSGPVMALAVLLTEQAEGPSLVVVTQDGGDELRDRIERWPVPLTQAGAIAWLAGGSHADQVPLTGLTIHPPPGQLTIYDP